MPEPKILISILNWNGWENTARTVRSVLQSDYRNYTILFLDNNSTDNSVKELRAAFPEIKLIKAKRNLGYAGAHMIGAKIAKKEKYDLLWLLNNDVEVYPSSLNQLVEAYKRNGEGLFGSLQLQANGETISFSGGLEMINENLVDEKSTYNSSAGKSIYEVELEERQVSGVQGASFLIPVTVVIKCGFLDTRFFLYGEEIEYCHRLRVRYKVPTFIIPKSLVIHFEGLSFQKSEKLNWLRIYYLTRNNDAVLKKYHQNYTANAQKIQMLPYYVRFFFKHFFCSSNLVKDNEYWLKYYTELGNLHAILKIKGRYLNPEKFLR